MFSTLANYGPRGAPPAPSPPPPLPEMTCGFLIQLVFCKKKTMWFIGVEVEQETSAPPPKKYPGSAPASDNFLLHQLHELSFSRPLLPLANRNIIESVRLPAVDVYSHFSFHHAIKFHPVERIATRSMLHSKRLSQVNCQL